MGLRLLSHFNGSDGATTTSDEIAGVTWTLYNGGGFGNAELDTAVKKFGSASLLLIPIAVPLAAAVAEATGVSSPHAGSWTVEGFVRAASDSGSIECDLYTSGGNASYVVFNPSANQVEIFLVDSGGGTIWSNTYSVTFNASTFYHWALVRDDPGGTYSLYFDGSRVAQLSSSTDVDAFDTVSLVANGPNMWVDEVRLGDTVEYSGTTYTVPSAEFVNGASGTLAVTLGSDTISATGALGTIFGGEEAVTTSEYGDLTTGILLGAEEAATTSEYGNLSLAQELGGEESASTSEFGNLSTGILLGGEEAATSSEYGNLYTQAAQTVLTDETDGGAQYDREPKPAIPPTTDLAPELQAILDALKENVETITGRRTGPIAALASDATLADVIEKVNQISRRLNA